MMSVGRALAMLVGGLLVVGCQTDRTIHLTGMFGDRYVLVVTRPYVYGGGEFCGSSVGGPDQGAVMYNVFVRASAPECEALIDAFDVDSNSREPFDGANVLRCAPLASPFACERATAFLQELATQYSVGGVGAVGAGEADREFLSEFFASDHLSVTRVLFGFDLEKRLSLECARFTRWLDDDGHADVAIIACRDGEGGRVVEVVSSEA